MIWSGWVYFLYFLCSRIVRVRFKIFLPAYLVEFSSKVVKSWAVFCFVLLMKEITTNTIYLIVISQLVWVGRLSLRTRFSRICFKKNLLPLGTSRHYMIFWFVICLTTDRLKYSPISMCLGFPVKLYVLLSPSQP